MDETQLAGMDEAQLVAWVKAELETKGEPSLQQQLQQSIQKTKRIESELSTMRNKSDQIARQVDSAKDECRKFTAKTGLLEAQIKAATADVDSWPARKALRLAELQEKMESIRQNVVDEAKTVSDKMDAQEAQNATQESENAILHERFATLKKEFEDSFKSYEEEWKDRETRTKETIGALKTTQARTDIARAQCLLAERRVMKQKEIITGLKEQLNMYETRFGDLEATVVRADDVESMSRKQQASLQQQLDLIEQDKIADIEEKKKFDQDSRDARTRAQQAKRLIIQLEKTKITSEKRCREAQHKFIASSE